jgi:hypothetical protein
LAFGEPPDFGVKKLADATEGSNTVTIRDRPITART